MTTPKFQVGDYVTFNLTGQTVTFRGEIMSVKQSKSGKAWNYRLTNLMLIGESKLTLWGK